MSGTIKNLRVFARMRDGRVPRKIVATILRNGEVCGVSFASNPGHRELTTNFPVRVNDGDDLSVVIDVTPPPKDLHEYREILSCCAITFEPEDTP